MTRITTPGPNFFRLIERWEGLRLSAYLDTERIPTIGYGTTSASGIPVKMGDKITKEQALEYLKSSAPRYTDALARAVKVPLNQNQFDALASWTYNVGQGAMQKSTLIRKLNQGDYAAVPEQLMRWTSSKSGDSNKGLTNRRVAEAKIFTTPPAGRTPLLLVTAPQTPVSPEKSIMASTQLQATSVAAVSGALLSADESGQLFNLVPQVGGFLKWAVLALLLASLAYVAYRRIYVDQAALR